MSKLNPNLPFKKKELCILSTNVYIYFFTVMVVETTTYISFINFTCNRHPGFHCLWNSETGCPFPLSSLKLRRLRNPSILKRFH